MRLASILQDFGCPSISLRGRPRLPDGGRLVRHTISLRVFNWQDPIASHLIIVGAIFEIIVPMKSRASIHRNRDCLVSPRWGRILPPSVASEHGLAVTADRIPRATGLYNSTAKKFGASFVLVLNSILIRRQANSKPTLARGDSSNPLYFSAT